MIYIYLLYLIIFGLIISIVFIYLYFTKKISKLQNDLSIKEEKFNKLDFDFKNLNLENEEYKSKINNLSIENSELLQEKTEAVTLNQQIPELKNELTKLKSEKDEIILSKEQLSNKVEHLETLLNEERKQFDEKLKLLEETKEQLKLEFENLSNSILTDNSKKFTEQNKLLLENVLSPFKNQITDFKKKIEEIYIDETKERSSLKNEIENLRKLNEQISLEAENLTNALKKDVKSQGDWGEIKLEMVLEASGLTKGLEYEVQLNLKDDEGDNFRPDVVVHLPDKRDIVIDSKVSLTAYERYVSAETKEEKTIAMKEHINSLRKHIRELSDKNYHKLYGINSLDFVLMFVYNEASYIAAIDFDKELLKEAFNKKILIVAPLTLYGTLKIINSLWKFDEQNKNAREIADKASKLYDKFVGFTDTFSDLGNSIQKVNSQYNNALKKLSEGRGNLISQAEKLKDLGVVTKKDLPDNMDKLLLPENKNGN